MRDTGVIADVKVGLADQCTKVMQGFVAEVDIREVLQ
jgi:hypothetical protein